MKRELLALLPPVVVGTALRCFNLSDQVLVGDEVHAIRAALHDGLATVLTTYRTADPCLPLAGLFRLFIEAGVPLSETTLRLPVLLTGIAALVALPLALGRLAPGAGPLFAWLLALSPALILYSRIVRPYAPIVLWSGLAAGCFWTLWNAWRAGDAGAGRARLAAAGFVACAALAVWFHLGTAPLVAALFAFALLDLAIARPRGWPRLLRNLAVTALVLAVALALPLVPAARSLTALVAAKRVVVDVPASTYAAVLKLQAGTASSMVAVLFWAVAIAGLVRLSRSRPRAALFTSTLVIGQVVGIRWLSPIALDVPLAHHRYLLPVLPFVLLWVAVALAPPESPTSRLASRRFALPLQAALVVGLVLAGPFTNRETWRTSFLHDVPYVDFSRPPPRPDAAVAVSAARLAHGSDGRPVVAAVWPPNRYGPRAFALAQQVHGRRVIVVAPGLAGHRQVAFRNFVAPAPRALLATGAQFFVLHAGSGAGALSAPRGQVDWPARLREEWGEPAWQDAAVEVWDLDAVRRRSGGG